MQGYAHPDYARALAEYGTPRELPRCGGWLLERPVPGHSYRDAMGCYPLFCCHDWSGLKGDLDELAGELICVHLVADPFGDYTPDTLRACFPERMTTFKQHYVLDLREPIERAVRKQVRSCAKAALRHLQVERCSNPLDHLDDWMRVYGALIEKHELRGIHAFSRASFQAQMNVPGLEMFRAADRDRTVGMLSWFVRGDIGYAHLMGIDPEGYRLGAAYALLWSSAQYFAGHLRWLDIGGVPGQRHDRESGLALFKRGWSNTTRVSYFCGRILDKDAYEALASANGADSTGHFPAYRRGEFGL
jgi:hypothetical protein